jgi:hypothetical protein
MARKQHGFRLSDEVFKILHDQATRETRSMAQQIEHLVLKEEKTINP